MNELCVARRWIYVEVPNGQEPRIRTPVWNARFLDEGFGESADHVVLLDTPSLKACWWPEWKMLDIFVLIDE